MFCRLVVCFCAVVFVGCGDGGPSVSLVTGKITLDSKPLANATINFSPVAGGTGKAAVGTSDAQGVYTVTDATSKKIGSGAVVGEYKVGVLWFKPDANDTSRSTGSSDTSMTADRTAATKTTGPESALPVAYQDPQTSGLTVTVKSGTNTLDIALDSKFKGEKK